MRPTSRAITLAVAGTVLALLPTLVDGRLWTFWPLFLAWFVAALGLDALRAPRPASVELAVSLPELLYVGRREGGRVDVRLSAARALPVEIALDLSDELEPLAPLAGRCRGEAGFDFELVPRRRGSARLEAVWLRWVGPLGLVAFSARRVLERDIPVVPDIVPVRTTALRYFTHREFRPGVRVERFRGEGTEFDSLQEFVPGDDARSIDWKPSARHRKLLARQFRAERDHQVVLAVDSGRLMGEEIAGLSKLDHALNGALLLAYVCLRSGDRVGFFAFDARVGPYLEPRGGLEAHRRLVRATTAVRYGDQETNYTLGLTTLQQRLRRRSLVVVFTDFVDTITAELMLDNLERTARRHLVLFVALRDPGLASLAAAAPRDALTLNRAVVARAFVRDRELVLRRLTRLGVLALDVQPAEVGARLIDRYLEVRRRERIG